MLNGFASNSRRLDVGARRIPTLISADAISTCISEMDVARTLLGRGDAVSVVASDFLLSAQKHFSGDMVGEVASELPALVMRNGSGAGVINTAGSLYYARLVLGSGGAEIRIIAISDVGVVYGSGSGVIQPTADLDGARVRGASASAFVKTDGYFLASAIRTPATLAIDGVIPLVAQLDSAHITSGGIRYIDGFGDAYAYLDIEDAGMRRQIVIGSMELAILAGGSASAVRNAEGVATINVTAPNAPLKAVRRGVGSAVISGVGELAGDVYVRGSGTAIITLLAKMTGYVYRQSGVLRAISTMAAELELHRSRLGHASAPLVCVITMDGVRGATGSSQFVIEINAQSSASDFDIAGMDNDDEIFYRPGDIRGFERPESIREWRRL